MPSVRPRPDGLVGGYNAILFPLDIRQLGNLLLPGQFEVLASLDKLHFKMFYHFKMKSSM